MQSLRTSYWYFTKYLEKHYKIIGGAVLLGVLLFAIILPFLTKFPQIKSTRYIGVIGSYDFANLPPEIQHQISRGLTEVAEDGTPLPDLAEKWSTEDDGKTYRFTLRKDIRWQDGKFLVPSDIKFNFQDTEITTTDTDVIFKLKEPFSPFPIVVTQPQFREVNTTYLRFWRRNRIVGLGAYSIAELKYKDNRLEQLILDNPKERIIYRFYLTEDRAKIAFKKGQIDYLQDISSAQDFSNWPGLEVAEHVDYDQYLGVFFNHDKPLFQKNIRQALSYALTKPAETIRVTGPISPNSWAYLAGVKTYDYDSERAVTRLLDGIPAEPMNITILTTNRFEADAQAIKTQWEALGQQAVVACQNSSAVKEKNLCENLKIQVQISITNFPDLSDYQVLLIGQKIPPDPDQYALWHSTQNTNFTHYKNPRIDALLENARKETDMNERKALYQEFQQFLLEDAPAIFLKYLVSYDVERK